MPIILISLLSGFAVLLSEVTWARFLSLAFGSATSATTVVITTFMAGLGIGGLFWGKKGDMVRNPLVLVLLLQISLLISSLVLSFILPVMPEIYRFITWNFNIAASGSLLLIFILSFLLMFIPTFMMGGIFPLLNRYYIKDEGRIKMGVSLLYGINTLGSMIGALLAGFIFIRNLGSFATLMVAILMHILVAVIIFLLLQQKMVFKESKSKSDFSFSLRGLSGYIPLFSGITGFTGLAYEVLWIRSLSVFLTNSTYVFTTMLIVILSGIFLGSLLLGRVMKGKNLLYQFGFIQIFIGLYVIIIALLLNRLPGILLYLREIIKIPLFYIFLPSVILTFIIAFIPAVLMGMSFPLLCTIYNPNLSYLGGGVGRIYFFNTLGSAFGSLLAGFLILPTAGAVKGLCLIALINLSLGAIFSFVTREKILLNISLSLCGIIIAIFATRQNMILPPSIYRIPGRSDKVLYYKETKDGTITISEDQYTGIRTCYVNNSAVIGTTYDALKVVKMLGHLPFIFNPKAEDVLVIGFGVGITTAAIARYPVKQIDCIEICPGLKEGAKYFAIFNDYVFNNPKVRFIPQDGRNFLLLTKKKYDIISCDPVHPGLGSGNLYTKEYFLLCRNHLKEGGVLCQYLPLHKLTPEEFKSLIRTFVDVFPDCSIWLGFSHGILLGTTLSRKIDFESFKGVKDEMLNDAYLLASSFILYKEDILKLIEESVLNREVNTDDRPFLEFFTPKSIDTKNWERNLKSLFTFRSNPDKLIANISDYERLQNYLVGQEYFISGLIYQNQGNRRKMLDEVKKALEVNPENKEIRIFFESESRKLKYE